MAEIHWEIEVENSNLLRLPLKSVAREYTNGYCSEEEGVDLFSHESLEAVRCYVRGRLYRPGAVLTSGTPVIGKHPDDMAGSRPGNQPVIEIWREL